MILEYDSILKVQNYVEKNNWFKNWILKNQIWGFFRGASHFCTICEHWLPCLNVFSRTSVQKTALQYRSSVSFWSKGKACLLFSIIQSTSLSGEKSRQVKCCNKRWRFPKLVVDVCSARCRHHWAPLCCPVRVVCLAMLLLRPTGFFPSEPEVLRLQPASIQLWQKKLLACKQGNVSAPSKLLTKRSKKNLIHIVIRRYRFGVNQ